MRVYSKMSRTGLALWFTGCIRMHKDGNTFNGIMHWWHPATWAMFLIMVLPCAVMGEKLSEVVPVRLSDFWLRNRAQLQWVTPFTDLSTLVPFDSSLAVPAPTPTGYE
jgi:hypothetical protein